MTDREAPELRALDLDVQARQTVYWAEVERRIGPVFARADTRAHVPI